MSWGETTCKFYGNCPALAQKNRRPDECDTKCPEYEDARGKPDATAAGLAEQAAKVGATEESVAAAAERLIQLHPDTAMTLGLKMFMDRALKDIRKDVVEHFEARDKRYQQAIDKLERRFGGMYRTLIQQFLVRIEGRVLNSELYIGAMLDHLANELVVREDERELWMKRFNERLDKRVAEFKEKQAEQGIAPAGKAGVQGVPVQAVQPQAPTEATEG